MAPSASGTGVVPGSTPAGSTVAGAAGSEVATAVGTALGFAVECAPLTGEYDRPLKSLRMSSRDRAIEWATGATGDDVAR